MGCLSVMWVPDPSFRDCVLGEGCWEGTLLVWRTGRSGGGRAQAALGLTVCYYCPRQAAATWGFDLVTRLGPALKGSGTPTS